MRRTGDRCRNERALSVALIVVPLLSTCTHLVRGAGFVLDDWFVLRNAEFDGAWAAAGAEQGAARPGSYPVFAMVFGVFGAHPVPGLLGLAATSAVTALLTYRIIARFTSTWLAATAALLWVVLPTHTSTEMWLTCSIIAVSQLLLTASLWLSVCVARSSWSLILSWVLLAASVLTYEASLPLALVGGVALPWLAAGRLDRARAVGAVFACGLPSLWILAHWYGGKSVQAAADPARLVMANFGWGLTPDGPGSPLVVPLVLVATAGVASALARLALPSFAALGEDRVLVAGLLVIALGFAPFVRYYYEPQGAGDRANYISAIGAAMVWASMLAAVRHVDRRVAVALTGVLLSLGAIARLERIQVWSAAGRDAQAIADEIVHQIPEPTGPVVIGPAPIVHWNVAAYLDRSNLTGALAVAYGRPVVDGDISYAPATWDAAPPELRVDIRRVSELDDLEVLRG